MGVLVFVAQDLSAQAGKVRVSACMMWLSKCMHYMLCMHAYIDIGAYIET